jgi:hypothetical protein
MIIWCPQGYIYFKIIVAGQGYPQPKVKCLCKTAKHK